MNFREFIRIYEEFKDKIKDFVRKLKYRDIYNEDSYPYLVKFDDYYKNRIPKNIWKMLKYSVKDDEVVLVNMRNKKEITYTVEDYQKIDDLLQVGKVKDKQGNGWNKIQFLEKLSKKDVEIKVSQGAEIQTTGKYSTETYLKHAEKMIVKKTDKISFSDDWIDVIDSEGTKIKVLFYFIESFE